MNEKPCNALTAQGIAVRFNVLDCSSAAHCGGDSDTGEVLALEAAVWSNWAGVEELWVQFRSWGLKE